MNRRFCLCIMILTFLTSGIVFGESEGEKYFRTNKPDLAISALEKEIMSGKASPDAYNYLGLAYFQIGDYSKSVDAFAKGIRMPDTDKKILAFNQGNSYYALGDYANAARSYSLTLTMDKAYTKALLNRANTYLMAKEYPKCIDDYELFLELEPNDPQRPQIEEILALLRRHMKEQAEAEEKAAKEAERKAEEAAILEKELERQKAEQLQREEEERIAAEKAAEELRLIEEERRRKMLEDVANSLQNTDSTNMSSGAEDIIDYEYESELD